MGSLSGGHRSPQTPRGFGRNLRPGSRQTTVHRINRPNLFVLGVRRSFLINSYNSYCILQSTCLFLNDTSVKATDGSECLIVIHDFKFLLKCIELTFNLRGSCKSSSSKDDNYQLNHGASSCNCLDLEQIVYN